MHNNQVIYKAVNDIQKLLASLLSTYPSVYLADVEGNSVDLNTMLLQPLMLQSEEFCSDLSNGRLLFKPYFQGLFGEVGNLKIGGGTSFNDVMLNHISVGPDKGSGPSYVVYHMDIVVKKSKKPENYYIVLNNFNGRYMFNMNNFLHEAMIASFASHLYDLGICPGVLKCFGNYVCPVVPKPDDPPVMNKKHHSYLVLQKSSFTLSQIIRDSKFEEIFLNMNAYDFMNIITQVSHTLYVMKRHFGIVPFDLHLKNVMLSYVKKGGVSVQNIPEESFIQEYYGGSNLNKTDYLCYELPELGSDKRSKQIIIQNNGFLVKIVDYCMAISEFNISAGKRKYGFPIDENVTSRIYWLKQAIENDKKYTTVSVNFFTYNLITNLYRTYNGFEGTDTNGVNLPPRNEKVRHHAQKICEELKPFILAVNPSFSFEKVSQSMVVNPNNPRKINFETSNSVRNFADMSDIMELRDVGEIPQDNSGDDIILKRIWGFLFRKNYNYAHNTTFITRNGMKPAIYDGTPTLLIPYSTDSQRAKEYGLVTNLTPMEKFMNTLFKYNSMCLEKGALKTNEIATKLKVKWDGTAANRNEICSGWQMEMATWDPRNRAGKTWAKDDVTNNNLIFDPSTGSIKKGINAGILLQAGFLRTKMTKDLMHFYLEIYPQLNATHLETNFKLEPHQSFHIGSRLSQNIGEFMSKVNIHLVFYSNQNMEVKVESGGNPFKSATSALDGGRSGIILGGGLYVTKENIQNLTPDITNRDLYKSIGFFYTEEDLKQTGTPIPVPNGYRQDWAVVAVINNQFVFFRYNDFENMHETVRKPYNVYLKDADGKKRIWNATETAIKVVKGKPVIKGFKPLPYQAAISLGPILVWEGRTIFSTKKMLKSVFDVNLTSEWPIKDKFELGLHNTNEEDSAEEGEAYTLYEGASNNSMYFADPAEKTKDPYKMRESNKVTSQTALCQTYDNKLLYISVEGDFNSPGLDRSQFAQLISHFNVRYAVSLNSGQTVSSVYRKEGESAKWLESRPYTSNVGTLIAIRQLKSDIGTEAKLSESKTSEEYKTGKKIS